MKRMNDGSGEKSQIPEEGSLPGIEERVRKATNSLSFWRNLPVEGRLGFIANLQPLIEQQQKELAELITRESGKPITEVVSQELTAVLESIHYSKSFFSKALKEVKFHYRRPGFWTKRNAIWLEPIGIFAVISPWNFPFSIPMMQLVFIVSAGNCAILKPSERSVLVAPAIDKLFQEAGFPRDVVQVVYGDGTVAKHLIMQPGIDKVVFTGSHTTGEKVAETCGAHFKPCVLELGGNGAALVCEDADLDLAAQGIVWSSFYSNGQSCVGTKRVFAHQNIAEKLTDEILKRVEKIKIGNPLDPTTEIGPLKDHAQVGCLESIVLDALGKGAEVAFGGKRIETIESGYYFEPTVLTEITPSMRVMQEEMFGPIVGIRKVRSVEQAIQETNNSEFGLSASIWSKDMREAKNIAAQLNAGLIWVNDSSFGLPNVPWGGNKRSGWGRMYSRYGLHEVTRTKFVSRSGGRKSHRKPWWFPYSREKAQALFNINTIAYSMSWRKKILSSISFVRNSILMQKEIG